MSDDRKRRKVMTDGRIGERGLWVNVILQAMNDAMGGGGANISGKCRELYQQQARAWFRRTNPDFIEVCSLAGLDPDATYEKAIAAIARYDAIIAAGETYKRPTQAERAKQERVSKPTREPESYTARGQTMTLTEWSTYLGVRRATLASRIHNCGVPPEDALVRDYKRRPRSVPPIGRRKAKLHTINGVSKTIAQWADQYGLKEHTLANRVRRGMTLADALSAPVRHHSGKRLVPANPDAPTKRGKARPGVVFDFGAMEGTGAGSSLYPPSNLGFSQEAAE